MAACERLEKCQFIARQMASTPDVAELTKQMFCFGDKTRCVRYQLSSAGISVPVDLAPQDVARARELSRNA